jgi:hypothetical protein
MTTTELPFRATTEQACDWLALQTGTPWTLARLLEAGLTPYVWLDYDAAHAELFGDANGGYAAPIFFEGDIARLAAGSEDVLITITKDVYRLPATLPAPGFRRALHALRFLKKEVERLPAKLAREAGPASESTPEPTAATESKHGIDRQQVLAAFAAMVKIDLEAALLGGGGMFGDDGARVKGSARKSKNKALWNPVTLALGLNDVYRVPIARLKKAFTAHDFLHPWLDAWEQSLRLLGK